MEKTNRRIFWLTFLAVSVWSMVYLTLNNKADWDLWGVMSFGALLDQNPHFFPYHDPFSYTAFGAPWIYHEWGSGVIFFQVFKHWGSSALFALKLLLVELIFLLACHRMFQKQQKLDWLLPLCLPVAAYLILPIVSTTIRCQLFTFVGYALFLMMLDYHRRRPDTRLIWLLPGFMALWVNVHGGFITGLVVIGAYLLHYWLQDDIRPAKQLAALFVLSSVATLINPYGLQFLSTMVDAWTLPRAEISEWGNVFTLNIPFYGLLYCALFLLFTGWGLWQLRKAPRAYSCALLLLVFSGLYGGLHYKLAPLFLITLLSVGTTLWSGSNRPNRQTFSSGWQATFRFAGYGVSTLLSLMALGVLITYVKTQPAPWITQVQGSETIRANQPITRFAYPLGVVQFIKENHIRANLWVPFSWGEFLYWALCPNVRVSVDGRYETVYSPTIFNAYYSFYHPPYRLANALQFPTTHLLIPRRKTELIDQLKHNPDWHVIYQDAMLLLYAKQSSNEPGQARPAPSHSTRSQPMDDFLGDLTRFRLSSAAPHPDRHAVQYSH